MKYLYKYLLLFFAITSATTYTFAQTNSYPWQLGFGIGSTNYYGDLSNYRISGANELYKIYRFGNYNRHYQQQPSFSVLLQKKITPTLGIMFQANYLHFSMSDRYKKNNGMLDTSARNFARSLNFKTTMQDAGFAFTFSPNNGRIGSENAFFYPSFYLGVGVSSFVVKGDLYGANNAPYNYSLAETVTDDNYETNLRDQRTETDNKFRNVEPYVDLGLALNFRLSQRFILSLQSDIKYSASDYLDDVSGTYKPSYPNAAEAYAAKPGYNVVNPATLQRGDNNGVNDFYINNRVVLSIALSKRKTTKQFNSPVIYSLNTSSYYYKKKNIDSVKRTQAADSILKVKADSINNRLKDSLLAANASIITTPKDSTVTKQLTHINSELSVIKQMLYDQQVKPRLMQLHYQTDSIKNLRTKLLIKRPVSEASSLQLRIYDLQIDSLRNEFEKAQRTRYNPDNKIDSSISSSQYDNFLNDYATMRKVDTVVATDLNFDSAEFRSTRLKKIDSIQQRLDDLQRKLSDTAGLSVATESVNIVNKTDSLNYLKSKVEAEDQLKQKDQDIDLLQRQLQASNDSAMLYKNLRENPPIATPDSVQRKTPWYQRYLGIGGKKKKASAVADSIQQSEFTAQQKFYESEARLANKKIDEVENDKTALAVQRMNLARENKLSIDSVEFERNASLVQKRIQQNSNYITSLQSQLQKSNDSAAYYKQLTIKVDDNVDEPKRKWYQNIFSSGRQRQVEQENIARENNFNQQQYYNSDVRNMQSRIGDLERKNNDLQANLRSYDSDRRERRRVGVSVIPAVSFGENSDRQRDAREIDDLKAQIQNLQNQVNYDARGKVIADTVDATRKPQIIVMPSPVTSPVNLMPDSSNTGSDTAQIAVLKNELNMLRLKIDSITKKPTPVAVEKVVKPVEKFDVASFPVTSVYFKLGSSVLPADQINKITPFARAAATHSETGITLKGFTDPVGSPEKNAIIANKRSEYIKSILVNKYKINDSRIIVEEPAQASSDAKKKANPLDRRVDLRFSE